LPFAANCPIHLLSQFAKTLNPQLVAEWEAVFASPAQLSHCLHVFDHSPSHIRRATRLGWVAGWLSPIPRSPNRESKKVTRSQLPCPSHEDTHGTAVVVDLGESPSEMQAKPFRPVHVAKP
jgi:hypothetical protein